MRLTFAATPEGITCSVCEEALTRRLQLGTQPEKVQALSQAVLQALSRATREHVLGPQNLRDLRHLGEELFGLLIPEELREVLRSRCDELLLELDEQLVSVPWELLHDGDDFLCRKHDIGRMITTSRPPYGTPVRRAGTPLRLLIVVSDQGGTLPQTLAEGEALAAAMDAYPHVRAELRVNPDSATIKGILKDFDAVHFSGHAEYCASDPSLSAWCLEGGKLSARDIAGQSGGGPLPLLVFSNACRSAHHDAWIGESEDAVRGLAHAFLLGGVRVFVGSAWDVVDERATACALEFWRGVANRLSVGSAMRRARREAAQAWGEESLAWAPYVLYGNPAYAPCPSSEVAARLNLDEVLPRPGHLATRLSMPYKRVQVRGHTTADVSRPSPWRRLLPLGLFGLGLLLVLGAGLFLGKKLERTHRPVLHQRTLALLGLSTKTSLEQGAELHQAAMESCLLASLAHDGRYRLLDRARIESLLRERGTASLMGPEAAQAGRELRADYVVYGEVAVVGGKPFFTILAADSRTQEVVFGETVDGFDSTACGALARRLLGRVAERDAATR